VYLFYGGISGFIVFGNLLGWVIDLLFLHFLVFVGNSGSNFFLFLFGKEFEVVSVGATNSVPKGEERTVISNILIVMEVVIVG